MKTIKFLLTCLVTGMLTVTSNAQKISDGNKPQTMTALKQSIQKILTETNTPGAGIVLVSGDETILLEGFGKADIENNIAVNENTMFRLGSISKMYVGLAILKLQQEGRLSLKDKVRDLIPEIKFDNPWEDQYPVRVENLLEHTAGWDEWHFAELGSDDPKPKTLKEALDFYPRSRTSRFIPGTRIGYSNAGMSVAAYIVEKFSGLTFENYIDQYFFKPMGMESMTFLQSEQYKKSGAKLYDNGIKLSYFNILYRPSAALNGSPKDMVNMIKFFINRGKINGTQIIPDSSLKRMERSESMPVLSKSELFKGYGLANSASNYNGFIYHGHGGSVPGGNADFAYLPEYQIGYAVMINGGDEDAVYQIAEAIKYYQTKDLIQKPAVIDHKKCKITIDPSGYYTINNPKIDLLGFSERIKSIQKVWIKNDTLYVKGLMTGNSASKFVPAGNNEFRSVKTNRIGLALINDPLEGYTIGVNLKKISPFRAYFLISLFFAFPITLVGTFILGLLSTLVFLFGRKKSKTALWVGLWPLMTNSFIFVVILSFMIKIQTKYDLFQLLGTMNPISILFLICSICYALASGWSVFYICQNRRVKMSGIFYFLSALTAALNFIFMVYFLGNGLIGIPCWL